LCAPDGFCDQVTADTVQEIPIRSFGVSVIAVRRNEDRNEVLMLKRTRSLRGEWCQVAGAVRTQPDRAVVCGPMICQVISAQKVAGSTMRVRPTLPLCSKPARWSPVMR